MAGPTARRNRYLKIVDRARAIPGDHGLRMTRVYLVGRNWSGTYTGEGDELQEETEVMGHRGYPPKVRQMNDEQLALAGLSSGSLKIGPLTPPYPGGGFDLEWLGKLLDTGETFHIRVARETGTYDYMLHSIEQDRPFRYMLTVKPGSHAT